MSEQEEGIPKGWKRVRIGTVKRGETTIGLCGDPLVCDFESSAKNFVILEKIEPPKPTYIPWDFDTMPDCVRVKAKEDGTRFIARPISDSSCLVKTQSWSYKYLFDFYTQLDGTPCGTVKVQE